MLLFLRGQFERSAELDFDGTLLATAHATANKALRARLAALARATGRVEWVRAIARGGQRQLAELSEDEWEIAVGLLTEAGHWEQLWQLALQAPPVWGVQMLRELGQRGWRPEDDVEQRPWREFTAFADACREFPAGGLFEEASIFEDPHGGINRIALTPDGTLLAIADRDGKVRLWKLPWGELTGTLQVHTYKADTYETYKGAIGVRGTSLPITRHRLVTRSYTSMENRVHCLAVTPDGKQLAGNLSDGKLWLWRLPSGVPAGTLRGPKGVSALAITQDGALLASASRNGPVRLWRSTLISASRKPIGEISLDDVERMWQSRDELPPVERAWVELIAALVRWRHRHDVELDTAPPTVDAGERDIELDG